MKRQAELDFLRAIAVSMVLLAHLIHAPSADTLPPLGYRVVRFCQNHGWMGVDLFFVLSGFLISGLLFREYQRHGVIKPSTFYIRRGLKIYPPFYVLFAITCAWIWSSGHSIPLERAVPEAFFLQNYFDGLWGHTWTLAVEEHFYFALPLLFLWLARKGGTNPFRHLPLVFVLIATACLLMRLQVMLGNDPRKYDSAFQYTHLRIDSLMFGVLISYYRHFHQRWLTAWTQRHYWRLWLTAFAFMAADKLPRSMWWTHVTGYTFIYLSFGCVLLALCCSGKTMRGIRWAAFVGRYSYAIYLWHTPLQIWGFEAISTRGFFVEASAYLLASVMVGIVMAQLAEFPVLRFRDRFFPSRERAI
jgi:peptidoglycan/LPS O-acetylase OafA/YrhL